MKKYKHLSLTEREKLAILRSQGISFRSIAKVLGRDHTTLIRELHRNAPYGNEYIPCKANRRYLKRSGKQRRKAPLKSPEIFLYAREKLKQGWSPGTISGRLEIDRPGQSIHPETIYRYIYKKSNRREHLEQYLTLKRKRRMKTGGRRPKRLSRIVNAISIDQRPKTVERRKSIGHWETDLMLGSKGSKVALQVNVERVCRYTVLALLPDKTSENNCHKMIETLKAYAPVSITSDNGLENAGHEIVSHALNASFYFCNPYHSWEKGTVENRIGVIRRYIPKGISLRKYSIARIKKLQDSLNDRPMKCLGYLSPKEYMTKKGVVL